MDGKLITSTTIYEFTHRRFVIYRAKAIIQVAKPLTTEHFDDEVFTHLSANFSQKIALWALF